MSSFPNRLGIILFNLGGPETLVDVKPFLLNLFNDPDILPIPIRAVRSAVAQLIVALRLKKVMRHYDEIGGGSPLRRLTEAQGAALERVLRQQTGADITVRVGMRYWKPCTDEVMNEFSANNLRDIFLLPLYPQYSKATSGSSFKHWKALHNARGGKTFRVRSIREYNRNTAYLHALSSTIDAAVSKFNTEERKSLRIVFSAHGLPASLVASGDPYQRQIIETVDGVMKLRGNDFPFQISYQSKVGPTKWLKPYTIDTLQELGTQGVKNLLVVPVAFVSDHIETLHELNIELREIAENAGVVHYEVSPGLNDRPDFIAALADIISSRYR